MVPPRPEPRPYQHTEHGVVRDDPWHWLRDREDPAVLAHLEAENRYAEQQLAHLAPLRQQLYAEMIGRLQQSDRTAPVWRGPWRYYSRTIEGRPYHLRCRAPREGGAEQVLLDENAVAAEHGFSSVRVVQVSPDHRTLAWTTDFTGEERNTLRFRDLSTGVDWPDELPDVGSSVAWAADSRTVWYCGLDRALRPHRVYRYTLGSGRPPEQVVDEPDESFHLSVDRTRSGAFLRLSVWTGTTAEVRLSPADAPEIEPIAVFSRQHGAKYRVAHAGSSLFVLTNVGPEGIPGSAVQGRLLEIPLVDGALAHREATERIAHRADVGLEGLAGFAHHLVLEERVHGQLGLRVLDLDSGDDRMVALPEVPSVVRIGETREFDAPAVRVRYTSMTTPYKDSDLDLRSLEWTPIREQPVPGYDRTRYRTEQLEATAPDGTAIPISIVYRADLDLRAGPHPILLDGYGAYGATIEPEFVGFRVGLFDRGVAYAIAHIRGGGLLGQSWYEAGKLQNKENSISDFLACARHLIDRGITAPDRLAAFGGSGGGLVVGASINRAPELFRAVLAWVPFVDGLTTMLDRSLPLTIAEYGEWGDPREREVFDRMRAYTPYENVRAARYPSVFATAGFADPRVQYWEPVKWIARLRERATGGSFLVRVLLGAGHSGPSGRYGWYAERADEFAWLLEQISPEVSPRRTTERHPG